MKSHKKTGICLEGLKVASSLPEGEEYDSSEVTIVFDGGQFKIYKRILKKGKFVWEDITEDFQILMKYNEFRRR